VQVGRVTVQAEMLRNLPHMPGFSLPVWKDDNQKQQNWGVFNGTRIETSTLAQQRSKFVQAERPKETWKAGSFPDSHTREIQKNVSLEQKQYMQVPAWDALDRHVLSFNGYFKEAVVETNVENYRVRKVIVYYFLEDDTCQVTEPKEDNSGIPQGTLIRRHKIPVANGGHLKAQDLRIGMDLNVYGKTFRITSCDPFTRQYFLNLGVEQPEPLKEEVDPTTAARAGLRQLKMQAKQPRTAEKMYREAMLGGGHVNQDMQQFLENDRKVLRFYAILDDVQTSQFERRPFIILFFLADDTMEIREVYPPNCGRDSFPIFFRRGKLARGSVEVRNPQANLQKKEEFVHGHEIYVGQMVTLSGNQFFVYDADEYTRRYFTELMGVTLEPKCDVQLPERAVPRAVTPPYNGYGSNEDSMSSVINLIPKVPKKDLVKLFNNEGKILRFTARLSNSKPEDQKRLFIFNFHLFDDTLSIHEPPQRNLGIITGRFLEKGVHVNQQTGDPIKAEDLLPGKMVSVFNHVFEMIDMDEYSRKTMENPDREHKTFDLDVVMEKMRESMRQQFPLVRDIFRRFDSNHDGVLTLAEFKQALAKYGFNLSTEEVMIVMKHFDRRRDGQVGYNEFCDALLDEDYTVQMMKTKPHLQKNIDVHYAQRATAKSVDRQETAEIRRAVRELGDMVYQRHGILHKLFKEFEDMTHEHVVSNEDIKKALGCVGITFKLEDIDRVILYIYPNGDLKRVGYVDFFKSLMATFHDLSAVR